MGKASRPAPERLAGKLLKIRQTVEGGISQNEMLNRLGLEDILERDRISKYERGTLDPPWFVLIAYAELANIWLEVLVKDDLELPEELPAKIKSEGVKMNSL